MRLIENIKSYWRVFKHGPDESYRGRFEATHQFTVSKEFIKKCLKINPPVTPKFVESRHRIHLPYGNGNITIYTAGSMAQFLNWPHDADMLRRSIKATGKYAAIRQLQGFIHEINDCPQGIKQEMERLLSSFSNTDLIIIMHTKDVDNINFNYSSNYNKTTIL